MYRRTRRLKARVIMAASTAGLVLFVAAAAFACTNHKGDYWFCPNSFGSSGCLKSQRVLFGSLVNNTNYYLDGVTLEPSTTHQFRWALTTDSEATCHAGTQWTSAGTDSGGNITTSPKVYTGTSPGAGDGAAGPGAGSWQMCGTNNTGDNYMPHFTITIT